VNLFKKGGITISFLNNGKEDKEKETLEEVLTNSIEIEEDLMRTYLITAERIHDDDELKERLENFAEGNAKRTKQLIGELNKNKQQ
jgi:rubrerythrin